MQWQHIVGQLVWLPSLAFSLGSCLPWSHHRLYRRALGAPVRYCRGIQRSDEDSQGAWLGLLLVWILALAHNKACSHLKWRYVGLGWVEPQPEQGKREGLSRWGSLSAFSDCDNWLCAACSAGWMKTTHCRDGLLDWKECGGTGGCTGGLWLSATFCSNSAMCCMTKVWFSFSLGSFSSAFL